MLLSRVADALYWISRYLERAEHTVRVVDVRLELGIDREAPGEMMRRTIFDAANPDSVIACVIAARENARQVREEISSDMFSRKSCYFFVRPKKSFLEVVVFLGRTVKAPQVRRVEQSSRTKLAHIIPVRHRDEVEAPITDWLREAYERSDVLSAKGRAKPAKPAAGKRSTPARKSASAKTAADRRPATARSRRRR